MRADYTQEIKLEMGQIRSAVRDYCQKNLGLSVPKNATLVFLDEGDEKSVTDVRAAWTVERTWVEVDD